VDAAYTVAELAVLLDLAADRLFDLQRDFLALQGTTRPGVRATCLATDTGGITALSRAASRRYLGRSALDVASRTRKRIRARQRLTAGALSSVKLAVGPPEFRLIGTV
jgi:hypothetical protein